jgi:hypothetical protein
MRDGHEPRGKGPARAGPRPPRAGWEENVTESSRRRFLRLAAMLSALAGAAPAALARAATRRAAAHPAAKPAPGALPPALAAEIARQKSGVAQALKVVREYPLPPTSEPAYRFSALRRERDTR